MSATSVKPNIKPNTAQSIEPRIKLAIVGCGLIGSRWDAADQHNYSLSHAAGFSRHPAAHLLALCDQDLQKAEQAAQRWGAERAFADTKEMLAQIPLDMLVVASSSSARWSVIEPALAAGIKYLVIEKPLASTAEECRQLVTAMDAAGAKTIVNYSRRWDPAMRRLSQTLDQFGPIQRLIGSYGKGLRNNGSHMIDLVAYLLSARPIRARCLGSALGLKESLWSNHEDRSWDAQIEYCNLAGERFELTMLGTDQSAFSCFELRIIGRRGICDITQGGRKLSHTQVVADPHYAGYRIPGEAVLQETGLMQAMDAMVAQAVQLAKGQISRSSCDVHDALLSALCVQAIEQSALDAGRWQDIEK